MTLQPVTPFGCPRQEWESHTTFLRQLIHQFLLHPVPPRPKHTTARINPPVCLRRSPPTAALLPPAGRQYSSRWSCQTPSIQRRRGGGQPLTCGAQFDARIQNNRWFGISSGSPARSAVRARGQVRAPPPPPLLSSSSSSSRRSRILGGWRGDSVTKNIKTHTRTYTSTPSICASLSCVSVARTLGERRTPEANRKQFGASLSGPSYFCRSLRRTTEVMHRQLTEK